MTSIRSITTRITSLYEQDFYLWLQTHINLLTGLPIQIFPRESPFTREEVLNPDFLPSGQSD